MPDISFSVLADRDNLCIDFIKIDVEGAELEVLRGAVKSLHTRPRPVILYEVQDGRTRPAGYRAKEIVEFLLRADYHWLRFLPGGTLASVPKHQEAFDKNLVASPIEGMDQIRSVLGSDLRSYPSPE